MSYIVSMSLNNFWDKPVHQCTSAPVQLLQDEESEADVTRIIIEVENQSLVQETPFTHVVSLRQSL